MGKLTPFIKLGKDQLQIDMDYLFCPICRIHVPCRRLESGGWEVLCPGCLGECAFCDCYPKRFCFGNRQQFPPFDLRKDQPSEEK